MKMILLALLFFVPLPEPMEEFYPDNATEIPGEKFTSLPISASISVKELIFLPMTTPDNKGSVSYMYYTAISNRGSDQWRLQQGATTDGEGFRRTGEAYMVATSQFYGRTGDLLRITYADGTVILAVIGDSKQAAHTEGTYFGLDGSLLEFIVDRSAWKHSNIDRFRGKVVSIEKEVRL